MASTFASYFGQRSTIAYTTAGAAVPAGSIYTVSSNVGPTWSNTLTVSSFSTLTGSTITVSTLRYQSTIVSLGASTNQSYINYSNGSYTTGWASTLTSLTSTVKVSMAQNGTNILALRTYTSSISTSVNSGVTWSTLTGTGLPNGSPTYTTLAQSATGQYQLVAAGGLGLFYSNNSGTTFTASALNTTSPYTYVPFDGSTAVDAKGNATITVSGSPAYVAGQAGQRAVYLNNSAGGTASQYIRGTWTAPTNFTVSFWFNPQSSSATQILFSVGTTASVIAINSSNQLYFTSSGGSGFSSIVDTLSIGTWYYLTAIYQANTTCTLYLNGFAIATGTCGSSYGTSTGVFGLGTSDANLTLAFNGYIDEFRLYTSAVTAAINPIPYFNNVAVSGTGQYMYATANNVGGLYASSNYGVTWTQQAATPFFGPGTWNGLTVSNSGQYVAAETNFISPQLTGLTTNTWTTGGVTWIATAVSNPSFIYYAFNNLLGDSSWNPTAGNYSGGTTYSGGVTTTVTGIGSVSGDWLQIQASVPLVLYSYSYGCGNYGNATKSYVIAGSNDGSTWYAIQSATVAANPFTVYAQGAGNYLLANFTGTQTLIGTTPQSVTCTSYATSTTAYTYFRIIGTLSFGGYFQIGEWPLNFIGGHTISTNYGSTWSLSPYPATTLSPNSASATTATWTANGATWTSSVSSSYDANNPPYGAFNNVMGTGTSNNWSSYNPSYSTTTGAYTAGTVQTTTVLGGVGAINGEWLQIQSSIPLVLYSYNYSAYFYLNIPKTYIIVGSNDGTNWYPLQSCSMTTNPFTGNQQSMTSYIIMNQPGTQPVIGSQAGSGTFTSYSYTTQAFTYFRMVCQTVYTSAPLGAVHIGEWYMNFVHPTAYPSFISSSGNGQYSVTSNNQTLALMNNYLGSFTTYTLPTLSSINALINCMSVSTTGQYMVVMTQGTTNNVYYSTNYGANWTALTVGSSAMTSCAISYDGSYITVSNATTVYTLNTNSLGYTISVGSQAGAVNQGQNAIAIGNQAGAVNQAASSIVLNASGSALNAYNNGFFVAPIANTATSSQGTVTILGYGTDSQVTQLSGIYGSSAGYLGIGTTLPQASLHIQGNTLITNPAVYNLSAAAWYIIGYWDCTASQNAGAHLKVRLIGCNGYGAPNTTGYNSGGETTIYLTNLNNLNATVVNIDGVWKHEGGYAPITTVKVVQNGSSRYQYYIYAYVQSYTQHAISAETTQGTIWTTQFTSTSDPGGNSSTVQLITMSSVSSGSNVGIGTTNPGYPLHVIGNINLTGSILYNGVAITTGTGSIWTAGSGSVAYYTAGNVGIGTATPAAKLSVIPADGTTNYGLLSFINSSGYGVYVNTTAISSRGNTMDWYAYDYNFGGNNTRHLLTMRPEGLVGIGTTFPAWPLSITTSNFACTTGTNVSATVLIAGSFGPSGTSLGVAGGYIEAGTNYSQNTYIAFGIGGGTYGGTKTERMRLVDTGFVGIGTTNPSVALQVNGTIMGSRMYSVSGSLTVGTSATTIYTLNGSQSGWINLYWSNGSALYFFQWITGVTNAFINQVTNNSVSNTLTLSLTGSVVISATANTSMTVWYTITFMT